jgi:membrane fusion protein, multidrug efflux system
MRLRAQPAHKAIPTARVDRSPAAKSSRGAVVIACAWWTLTGCSPNVEQPEEPEPPTVLVVEARRMNMPIQDSALGHTFALEQFSIRAGVPGIIEERHVEAGTHVRKGQLLFVIGAKRLRPELDDAKLNWAEAKAKPGRPMAGSDSSIQRGRDDVTQPDTPAHAVESELNRFPVYAPIDGRVGAVQVQLGDLVRPAGVGRDSSELTTIEQLDPIGVCVPVDSRVVRCAAERGHTPTAVGVGAPPLDQGRKCSNMSKVCFADGKVNTNTSTIMIRAQLDNGKRAMLPGETIRVTVFFGEVANAMVVPEQAVLDTRGASSVYVVNEQRRVEFVPVRVGFAYDRMRVIESGLEPGQTVVLDGFQMIRNGQEVRPRCLNPIQSISRAL